MDSLKYDMHVHTAEVSPCGMVTASKLVRLYKQTGYHGIVITDHYFDEYFISLGRISWEEKIENFLRGYRNARAEGQKIGLTIILGIELRFIENSNDYLIYGIDESFLMNNKELYKLGLTRFRELIKNEDIFIYQAHPFRSWVRPADPTLLDGVEVFNGNPRQINKNHRALEFATTYDLKMISGSDFHQREDLAKGGIIIEKQISTSAELYRILRSNEILQLIDSN
jgi:predicted metal-dependent phosphoesterase TrpH